MKKIIMIEGDWKIQFETSRGQSPGVMTFRKGEIFGGDSHYRYCGKYSTVEPDNYDAIILAKRRGTGSSVFGDIEEFELRLTGTVVLNDLKFVGVINFSKSSILIISGQRFPDCKGSKNEKHENI